MKAAVLPRLTRHWHPSLAGYPGHRSTLPEDGLFVDELTQIGYVTLCLSGQRAAALPVNRVSGHARLGYCIGHRGSACAARRTVVSVSGDGGAMFAIAELATAVHHNIPVNIIVMNDNAFGNVRGIQRDNFDARFIASDLTSPDFVALAKACGVGESGQTALMHCRPRLPRRWRIRPEFDRGAGWRISLALGLYPHAQNTRGRMMIPVRAG